MSQYQKHQLRNRARRIVKRIRQLKLDISSLAARIAVLTQESQVPEIQDQIAKNYKATDFLKARIELLVNRQNEIAAAKI